MENYNQPTQYNQQEETSIFSSIGIDANDKSNLAEAAKWASFLGILGLVMLALVFLGGLSMMFIGSAVLDGMSQTSSMPFGGAFLGILYLVMGLLYIYPTWALYKFGASVKAGLRLENHAKFSEGLLYLKRFFKFIGILTVIIIAFYIIVILAVGAGGLFGALG